jgi:hypothetical protein
LQDKNQLGVQANLCLSALVANRHKNPTLPEGLEKGDILDMFDFMEAETLQELQKVMARSMSEIGEKVSGQKVESKDDPAKKK